MGSAIAPVYAKSWSNATLARWWSSDLAIPQVDCAACTRKLKCCDFQPFVPNFLLGGWLGEENLTQLPENPNVNYTPIGAVATPEYRAKHDATNPEDRGEDMRCGFYKNNGCSLWVFRPGECSTYFCDPAMETDARQSQSYGAFAIESAVAQMALVELGFTGDEIAEQVDLLNGSAPRDFSAGADLLVMYKKAWNWSQSLSKKSVLSWMPK